MSIFIDVVQAVALVGVALLIATTIMIALDAVGAWVLRRFK